MPEQKTSKRQIIRISASLVLLILAAFEQIRHNDFITRYKVILKYPKLYLQYAR